MNASICYPKSKGFQAFKLHSALTEKRRNKSLAECPYPCEFSNILLSNRDQNPVFTNFGYLTLQFAESVKVTTFSYAYGELELLAELGGYVGLFLGYSVFHLSSVIDRMIKFWFQSRAKII